MYGGQPRPKARHVNDTFNSFTDIKSRYLVIYFGSTKDEALRHFKAYKALMERQTGNKIKKFHSDNGGEYINNTFKEFCAVRHG
jgi:transposase InsO family protein